MLFFVCVCILFLLFCVCLFASLLFVLFRFVCLFVCGLSCFVFVFLFVLSVVCLCVFEKNQQILAVGFPRLAPDDRFVRCRSVGASSVGPVELAADAATD